MTDIAAPPIPHSTSRLHSSLSRHGSLRQKVKMGCFTSKEADVSDAVACKGMPPAFHMTNSRGLKDQHIFHLSARGFKPFRAIETREAWGSRTVLYSTGTSRLKPLVHAARKNRDFVFYLPDVPGAGIMACEAKMRRCSRSDRYRFTLMVGHKGNYRNEAFEWRRIARDEMRGMSHGPGWKLVRLGPPPSSSTSTSGTSSTTTHYSRDNRNRRRRKAPPAEGKDTPPESSRSSVAAAAEPADVTEVVAAMVEDEKNPHSVWFRYQGSGNTDEIGYHWILTAAMSSICILEHQKSKQLDGF